MTAPIAFLFLGETLLIPHLYPIVEAIAEMSDVPVDLWVSTSLHEDMLQDWVTGAGYRAVRIRRAPGFRRASPADGCNPPLPAKLPMLARLALHIARASVAVCAEQTSLWLPMLLPLRTRFVKTSHGVGSMSARDDRRRRAPALTMVPSEQERRTYLDRGFDPQRIIAIGYVKASFRQRSQAVPPFARARPILLYTPHWQAHRSSWPAWGAAIVEMLAGQERYNVILAPHQRAVESFPEMRAVLRAVADLPHVHCDLDSFATIDGSYTALADIYLGDTSSQVIEYLMRPRPAVFLNAAGVAWADDSAYGQWRCGDVVDALADVMSAIDRARARHAEYGAVQSAYAQAALGDTGGEAPGRAARLILAAAGAAGYPPAG